MPPPHNHHNVAHFPGELAFPFSKNYFAAVVLRFPTATTEMALGKTISECKRVLAPGGHLELCTIDLDMLHMGTATRRAVRDLKTTVNAWDPSTNLKPASDHVQWLLGRRGFDRVNRCVVKVPVSAPARLSEAEQTIALAELLTDSTGRGDASIGRTVARVGRWWYSRCYEEGVLKTGMTERSVFEEEGVLAECERLGTTFKVLLCYARKPDVVRRRTRSL